MIKSPLSKFLTAIITIFSITALISGCGENSATNKENPTTSTNQNAAAVTDQSTLESISVTDLAGKTVEFSEVPQRIVTFSSGDMSIVYALGGTVVGRPTIEGEVPTEVKDIADIGTTIEINIEKVAALQPDLIIAHRQLNAKDIPALEQLGAKILLTGAASLDENNGVIEMLGKVLHKTTEAETLVKQINDKVTEVSTLNSEKEIRCLIIFGVPSNWMVALPDSLSGNLLEAVGGFNIAKDYPKLEKFPQYAQMNSERIIEADPQVLLLISPGPQEIAKKSFMAEMSKNPSWKNITAMKQGNFIMLPNSLFGSNPGAKIMDSLEYLNNELQKTATK